MEIEFGYNESIKEKFENPWSKWLTKLYYTWPQKIIIQLQIELDMDLFNKLQRFK